MTQSETKTKGAKPTHRLYRVEGDGDKASWTPIGAAWAHRDGKGFNITLDAVPVHGRVSMRLITEKAPAEGGQQ